MEAMGVLKTETLRHKLCIAVMVAQFVGNYCILKIQFSLNALITALNIVQRVPQSQESLVSSFRFPNKIFLYVVCTVDIVKKQTQPVCYTNYKALFLTNLICMKNCGTYSMQLEYFANYTCGIFLRLHSERKNMSIPWENAVCDVSRIETGTNVKLTTILASIVHIPTSLHCTMVSPVGHFLN